MAIELFGYKIGKASEEEPINIPSFVPPSNDSGAVDVNEGGVFGTTVDLDGIAKTETSLITRYREMAYQPEVDRAVDDVCNEAIINNPETNAVEINLDKVDLDDQIKKVIREEFDTVTSLLEFNNKGYEIFRRWYVDGRVNYHLMINTKNPREGIKEVRYIDPRKIKLVRVAKRQETNTQQDRKLAGLNKKYNEYFVYSPTGLSSTQSTQGSSQSYGIRISKDSIAYVHSGIFNETNAMILGHLHKAIKPYNQLRMLEDATVIYRLARAPERRIFYIDVGNLPKAKAEQYLRDMMVKHKNKLVYDANTGDIRDDRKFLTMLEDYWLPRREGGRGTEISTLPGGQNLGEIEDVQYFRRKLYESLNVPVSRLESDNQFQLGRASEISRDEIKFAKFISRLRVQFSHLFEQILEKQLLLKGVMTRAEWNKIKNEIRYDYIEDNHFSEMKDIEVLRERLQMAQEIDEYVGKYFSSNWVRKNILRQTDDEIEEMNKEIEEFDSEAEDNEDLGI